MSTVHSLNVSVETTCLFCYHPKLSKAKQKNKKTKNPKNKTKQKQTNKTKAKQEHSNKKKSSSCNKSVYLFDELQLL